MIPVSSFGVAETTQTSRGRWVLGHSQGSPRVMCVYIIIHIYIYIYVFIHTGDVFAVLIFNTVSEGGDSGLLTSHPANSILISPIIPK